jgi:hypothetical protein
MTLVYAGVPPNMELHKLRSPMHNYRNFSQGHDDLSHNHEMHFDKA